MRQRGYDRVSRKTRIHGSGASPWQKPTRSSKTALPPSVSFWRSSSPFCCSQASSTDRWVKNPDRGMTGRGFSSETPRVDGSSGPCRQRLTLYSRSSYRTGDRAAEGTGLLNRRTGYTGTTGSNPVLSASRPRFLKRDGVFSWAHIMTLFRRRLKTTADSYEQAPRQEVPRRLRNLAFETLTETQSEHSPQWLSRAEMSAPSVIESPVRSVSELPQPARSAVRSAPSMTPLQS